MVERSSSASATPALASTPALGEAVLFQHWYDRGEEEARAGHYSQALRCFEEAAVVKPDDPEALLYQAVCLIHLGQPQRALGLMEQVLGHAPQHPQAWLFRGVALHRLGFYREAYTSYERATSLAVAS